MELDSREIENFIREYRRENCKESPSYGDYVKAYEEATVQFGRDAVHYLERMIETGTAQGQKKQASIAVVREWKERYRMRIQNMDQIIGEETLQISRDALQESMRSNRISKQANRISKQANIISLLAIAMSLATVVAVAYFKFLNK